MEWYSLFDYSLPDERSWDGVKILFVCLFVCKGRYTDLVSSRFFVIANTCLELDSVTPNKYCPRAWDRQRCTRLLCKTYGIKQELWPGRNHKT